MWAPESLWTIWKREKSISEASIRTTFRPTRTIVTTLIYPVSNSMYRGAGKSLARPGRKQATETEYFDVHTSHL